MKNQRLLSLLLALCCLVTLLPFGTVSAYAAEPENTVKTLHVPCQVNPLYADILGDDAAVCVAPSAPAKVYGEINYIPESEVVPTVRQALVNREAVIEIHYKTAKDSGALTGNDLVAFFD